MGDGRLPLDCTGGATTRAIQGVHVAQKAVGRAAHLWLADGLSPIG